MDCETAILTGDPGCLTVYPNPMYDRRLVIKNLSAAAFVPFLPRGREMKINVIDRQETSYSQAVEITNPQRWLYISGQIPSDAAGNVPTDFAGQARLAWQNIFAQLARANMHIHNLIKVTIFLSDRRYRSQSTDVRHEVLGEHAPALTVVIATIFDEAWMIEIEAVAAA
jgi:2-iminobutanoate/2-iminopropanoate deaminase